MAIGDITFVKGQGGLGRPLSGQDFISGLVFYTGATFPSGWSTASPVRALFSVSDAENAGILPGFAAGSDADANFADATAATGTITVTAVGATGDTVTIASTEIPTLVNGISTPDVVSIGTYTITTADNGDSTGDTLAASLASFINSGTYQHGYSAVVATNVVTYTCPRRLGAYVPVVAFTRTGTTFTATLVQPSGGKYSSKAIWHYHISEYFRLQPQGQLYVGFFAPPSTYTFSEITTVQTFSGGIIRQTAVLKDPGSSYNAGDLQLIHNEIVTNDDGNHMPMLALYAADLSAVTDLSTLTNLNTLTANKATAIISQDGGALGAYLYAGTKKSITTLGAALGAVSYAAVNESIEWRGKFNISNGYECDTPAFANGALVSSVAQNLLDDLDGMRYVFLIKNIGFAGSYFNGSHTATIVTSDYAYIENNRTIDKAIRGVYSSLLPALGAPIVLNSDGTFTDESIAYFTSLAELNLRAMVQATELSDFEVLINSTQNVLSTNTLVVAVELIPVGVARAITVNIGFVVALT
jgi:hypothetical protein